MSKDQLSWEQLLSETPDDTQNAGVENGPSDGVPVASSEASAQDADVAAASTAKAAKKKRTTKSKSTGQTAGQTRDNSLASLLAEKKTEYAKKDWSKLEVTSVAASSKTTVPTPDAKVAVTENFVVTKSQLTEVEVKGELDAVLDEPKTAVRAEPAVLTVTQLNKYIREMLEGKFSTLWLKAEISNFKAHTSGHFYFSLKDSKSMISAVMFRGYNSQLRFRPEDGMEVLVRGKITVYEPRGNYQIFCESMEPVGAGALQKAYEQLKNKLQREGLFDASRKRPLPALPKHIAIVTSPTGAAIRDMLNVLGRRFKGAQITIIPCKVQGDQAPREIIEALRLANLLPDVDVIIAGRGGGSIEDLWAFNDEGVARAIAAARVPIISAVGHEVDFTIADFVADLRAPTPSAAAELVVKSAADLLERVRQQTRSLRLAMLGRLAHSRQTSTAFSKRLVDPQRRIQDASMRCDELLQRLQLAMAGGVRNRRMNIELLKRKMGSPVDRIRHDRDRVGSFNQRMKTGVRNTLQRKREGLSRQMAVLDSLSPLKVLDRGYSMVMSEGAVITDANTLKVGQPITVRMCNGSVDAQVTKIEGKR